MWFEWLIAQVKHWRSESPTRSDMKVDVICRNREGYEFSPFSISWRGSTLILEENDEK